MLSSRLMEVSSFGSALTLFLLAASISSASAKAPDKRPYVTTSRGQVTGAQNVNGLGVTRFTLPYAVAPVRFEDPKPYSKFNKYDASKLPKPCAQGGDSTENCLFITIYQPPASANDPNFKSPVFVWVHGGSFLSGGTAELDGAQFAASKRLTVVTVQYRLGVFGFLKNDKLGISGNFGLKDVMSALSFIKHEIGSFNGNVDKITLAGQSSGAEMIKSLLMVPAATTLFRNAILHSPPLDIADQTPAIGNAVGNLFAEGMKCTTKLCLQFASLSDIYDQQAALYSMSRYADHPIVGLSIMEPLRVVNDGHTVQGSFGRVVQSGGVLVGGAGKPLIFTNMKDEACTSVADGARDEHGAVVLTPQFLPYIYGSRHTAIFESKVYKFSSGVKQRLLSYIQVVTDSAWICPIQQSARNITSRSGYQHKIWQAQFDVGIPLPGRHTNADCANLATHESDISLIFTPPAGTIIPPNVQAAINTVQDRWAYFAYRGSPNAGPGGKSFPKWDPVSSSSINLFVIGGPILDPGNAVPRRIGHIENSQRADACALFGYKVPFNEQLYS